MVCSVDILLEQSIATVLLIHGSISFPLDSVFDRVLSWLTG